MGKKTVRDLQLHVLNLMCADKEPHKLCILSAGHARFWTKINSLAWRKFHGFNPRQLPPDIDREVEISPREWTGLMAEFKKISKISSKESSCPC